MKPKVWIIIGGLSAAVAIALGAIGAHGVEGWLKTAFEPDIAAKRLATWQTAAAYHRYHAIGLVLIGLMSHHVSNRRLHAAGWLMLVGTILFSGMLYVYSITGAKWMGPIFPIGGLSYILGWVCFAVAAIGVPAAEVSR